MLLYYPIGIFTFQILYIYLACGKKYESKSFASYTGASVQVYEDVVVIVQCAGSLKKVMRHMSYMLKHKLGVARYDDELRDESLKS